MRTVIAVALSALLVQRAVADPATADAELKQAEGLAANGDFLGAAAHYKLAYAADARPELICNAGVAFYKAKDVVRAHLYLSRCQERGTALDAGFVAAVRNALSAVETALRAGAFTPVDIVASPEGATLTISTMEPSDAFVGSRLLWLPNGKHTLAARAEGYTPQTFEIDAQGKDRQPITLTLQRTPALVVVPPPRPSARLPPREMPPVPSPQEPARPSKALAVAATSVSALALAVAGISYVVAHNRAERSQFALTEDQYTADTESIDSWNATFGVSLTVGIVGAAAASYLWYRALKTPARVQVDASGRAAWLTISGRW
jgi:hypothetical protein